MTLSPSLRYRLALVDFVLFATAFLLLFGFAAHAEYFGELGPIPAAEPDAAQLAAQALDGIAHGNWWIVAAAAVSLLTWGLRRGLLERVLPDGAKKWLFDHPAAGYATPFVLSGIGGVLTAFASGLPFSWPGLLLEVAKVGLGSVGLFIGAKTIGESRKVGAVAARAVDSKPAAVALLGKGPQP